MQTQGQPDRAVFETRATLESWDDDYYHPIALPFYDAAVSTMLELMKVEKGATVVDGGCGPGVHSVRVARQGHKVLAIDISQTMLDEAKARVAKAGFASQVSFQQEALTQLSFPDASFKYVFSWGVIIHIREAEKALAELCRIVEPGGKLALYVTNNASLDNRIEAVARFVARKPQTGRQDLKLGTGVLYEMHGEKLWVWGFDIGELVRLAGTHGMQLEHRLVGEFSEIQRRVGGPLRRSLLRLNNFCFRKKVSPAAAAANLLIFEKRAANSK
jgi:SAM-dependent methyltransferase